MKNKRVKPIVAKTYNYKLVGVDPKTHRNLYERVSVRVTPLNDTSFRVLGQRTYQTAKKRKDTYVTFSKPRIAKVTRRHGNTKSVTYFKRGK